MENNACCGEKFHLNKPLQEKEEDCLPMHDKISLKEEPSKIKEVSDNEKKYKEKIVQKERNDFLQKEKLNIDSEDIARKKKIRNSILGVSLLFGAFLAVGHFKIFFYQYFMKE